MGPVPVMTTSISPSIGARMRDKFVHWACNFLINHVATEWYRVRLTKVLQLGVEEYTDRLFRQGRGNPRLPDSYGGIPR